MPAKIGAPPEAPQDPRRFKCRHIFTDGRRCGSPALRHEHFCYYHHTTRPRASTPRPCAIYHSAIDLPLPEDRASIQLAIGQVILRIADGSLDPKRARLLLYGLQIASRNLPRHQHAPAPARKPVVEDFIPDPEHGTLAPIVELDPDDDGDDLDARGGKPRDIAAELARKWRLRKAEDELEREDQDLRYDPSPNLTHIE